MPEGNTLIFAAAFAAYTLAIVAVGIYSARFARRSDEDYFLAGRSLGPWMAALSASAASESGWVTLGLVGVAFSSGVQAYWIIPGCLLGYLFNWFVLAAPLRRKAAALGAVTLPDFFAFAFREKAPVVRALSVLVIFVSMLLYVAAQFAAAGKAFAAAFPGDVPYWVGVLIGGGVVLAYSVVGGFRAACWTELLQALLMVGALVGFPLFIMGTVGGYGFVLDELGQVGDGALTRWIPEFNGSLALFGFLLGSNALGINFGYPGQPHVLVRFMALRDEREARVGGVISGVWLLLVLWGAVTVGLLTRAMAESGAESAAWATGALADIEGAKETMLIRAAANMLPGLLGGAVLAAVLAAICSTASSQLVVAASAAATDLYARIFKRRPSGEHMLVNRLCVLGLGIGSVLMVIDAEVNVYKYVLTYGWAGLGAGFGPQVILLTLWRRATWAGCVVGMATGFGVAMIWPHVYGGGATGVEVYNLPLAFVCALVVNVVVSLATGGRRQDGEPAV